jgi:serine/threonine protein kinase
MSFEIGSTIGDYQIVQVLGAGGMGKVYKVRNVISDRVEAMKVLLPNLAGDPELADRFIREIKVQASLDHPNIAALHTAQRVDNQLLMIMEFVEGTTIDSMLKARKLTLRESVDYASQVLAALAYAHGHGVIHRDIKPPNMMLTNAGVVKLMDFGIAKIKADRHLTQTGRTVGSLYYMSPEQIEGSEALDPRSDLYSLGVSLYEMATGARPFQGDSDFSIMSAHMQQTPLPPIQYNPYLPKALNDIILMSIAKDPARRFQTGDAFRGALLNVLTDLPDTAAADDDKTVVRTIIAPAIPTGTPMAMPAQPRPAPLPPPPVAAPMPPAPPPIPPPAIPQPVAAAPFPAPAPVAYYAPPPPPPVQPQQAASSHRGLYMVVGSLVTLAVLVLAAIEIPKQIRARANSGGEAAPLTSAQPASSQAAAQLNPSPLQQSPASVQTPVLQSQPVPSTQQPQSAAQSPRPVQQQQQRSAPTTAGQPQPYQTQQQPQQSQQPAQPQVQRQPAGPDPAVVQELKELEHRQSQLSLRVEAVAGALNQLAASQASSGLSPSNDLTSALRRAQSNMQQASSQIRAGDPEAAKRSLDNAERDVEKLEHRFNL